SSCFLLSFASSWLSLRNFISSSSIYVNFFFQAEVGIRDRIVTGVQTCALPIFTVESDRFLPGEHLPHDVHVLPGTRERPRVRLRSEERRVGKECWSQSTPTVCV